MKNYITFNKMNKEKEKIFLDFCNSVYDLFTIKKIHSIKDLRNQNVLLSLLKEM